MGTKARLESEIPLLQFYSLKVISDHISPYGQSKNLFQPFLLMYLLAFLNVPVNLKLAYMSGARKSMLGCRNCVKNNQIISLFQDYWASL